MSLGTLIAATPKPFHDMTLPELRREREFWQSYADDPANTGRSAGAARDLCVMFDGLIARRERDAAQGVAA